MSTFTLFKDDMVLAYWNPSTGKVRPMSPEEIAELVAFVKEQGKE